MLNDIGWDGRLHRWRGSKTCSQAFLSEVGIPQIFSLWVVHCTKLLILVEIPKYFMLKKLNWR